MIKDELKENILKAVKKAYSEIDISIDDIEIEKPKNPEYGDWATNIAFKLSKRLKVLSGEIGNKIMDNFKKINFFEITNINGYLNFRADKGYYWNQLQGILEKKYKFSSGRKKKEKVQVEFISANPTGPLTLANGRGGFSGDALANVFKKAGYKVEREYYVNDGGNQVKILGESILISAGLLNKKGDFYRGEYIDKWTKEHSKEVEKLKNDLLKLGQLAAEDILKSNIKPAVKKMNIKFDNWFSENKLNRKGDVDKILDYFKKKDLIYKKDGALWFKSTKFGDDKDRVLIKTDGTYTYFACDSAYHWNKFKKRGFDKVINIWGADHHGDIKRVKAAVEVMGFGNKFNIIITQMVRLIKEGKECRISKRKGTYVTMDDLLELIGGFEKSSTVVKTREASDVARFFFLQREFNTHMDFDLDLAREHSEKNPVFYIKYAYARIHGILAKSKVKSRKSKIQTRNQKINLELLTKPEEINLIKELIKMPEIVEEIVGNKDYPVHRLTFYAQDIATKFHLFYDKCRVVDEKDLELTAARLKLVEATKIVLGIVMRDLIGIDTPERM